MNIIKEIQDIHTKIDYLIGIKKGEEMLDANTLQSELNSAMTLLGKSKEFITQLVQRMKNAEANVVSHIANTSNIENVVSNVSSQITLAFKDFADFLDVANSVASNTLADGSILISGNTVSNVTVSNNTIVNSIPSSTIFPTPTVEVSNVQPTIVQQIVTDVESIPTRIKTETGEIIQDVTRIVHNVDPRLLHTSTPVVPTAN